MNSKSSPQIENRRAPEQTQISISLPRDLLFRIDQAAKIERRNRSNFIVSHIEGIIEKIEKSGGKKKKITKPLKK
jgi:metal-responsive CopG/Arc/MetJ family transcriptional regulator